METLYITSKSDPRPPVNKMHLRLYSHHLCPYVERVRMVMRLKGISYQHVEVDLSVRPDWIFSIHKGAVPALEFPDGKIISESRVLMEYLDETYPHQYPLHDADHFKKTKCREYCTWGDELATNFWNLLVSKNDKGKPRALRIVKKILGVFEENLKEGTYFFGRDEIGFMDIYVFPHIERLFFIEGQGEKGNQLFSEMIGVPEYKRICEWYSLVKNDPRFAGLDCLSDQTAFVNNMKRSDEIGSFGLRLPLQFESKL